MRKYLNFHVLYFIVVIPFITDLTHSQTVIGEISPPPNDYKRIEIEKNSFAEYLRNLPLKEKGSDVINYRGDVFKSGSDTSVAFIVNMDIMGRRLEQCMDILVRLYAEYLWSVKQIDSLILPLPGGYWLQWRDWQSGLRPFFKGIKMKMQKSIQHGNPEQIYQSYLNTIYNESHTQQFFHAYQSVPRENVQIGDIIIKKGTKGHAVMIVDLAKNKEGELAALIGNGDTPACQLFLLNYKVNRPWIPLKFDQETIKLPLKRVMKWEGLRRFSLPKEKSGHKRDVIN